MNVSKQPFAHEPAAPGRPLAGRRCLITGAASGIGRAIAAAFAEAGAGLCLTDLDADGLARVAEELGGTAHPADVADPADVLELVRAASQHLGGIDVLVNCAGILTESPLAEMELATWQRTLDVDLTSVFLTCRAVIPGMVAAGNGRIINVASQLGQKGGAGLTHYSAAKAGVLGFTKALAREMSGQGVLVNAIAPGPISTPLVEGLSDEWKRDKEAELPLGRFGTPEEVAPTAVLLASDPGGNLYTGQTLGPNSGDVMA
ncbi:MULTISPECIES: SDR family NAD(P)-dependent oxidoreductase [unclassified Streptomyces]|uniref:SDR family NAD(P)-dependent oxidoreductase n=1 Tax=unclassified Streptomyces TaxID=2593676 RepID=UPI002DDC4D2B|nr:MULTISPECIES: SDR family NAD(P)-dependent oxidoreductase [unclassified Streptomyces]WSA90701.1 SDR family oxidoreductase [Streptomyces sp. NBC_01795]WSB75025.1 SDR family oxidoreductase [Streptomyces sp. NBC_01775]WSS45513.1 SDR family oxidoreductase [Streptomyces sp. NBC_01187]